MASWKLIATALKAQKTWSRMSPQQRQQLMNAAKTARAQGEPHARSLARSVREQGPELAHAASDAAKAHGPVVARRAARRARGGVLKASAHASEFWRSRSRS